MNIKSHYILIITVMLFFCQYSFAQKTKSFKRDSIVFGKYVFSLEEFTQTNIPREEILSIDSLTTNNDSLQIVGFKIGYNLPIKSDYNVDQVEGTQLPKRFSEMARAMFSGYGFNIGGFQILYNGKKTNVNGSVIGITIDSTFACIYEIAERYQDNSYRLSNIGAEKINTSKQNFLRNDKIGVLEHALLSIEELENPNQIETFYVVTSYTIEIISNRESKQFKVNSNKIPEEVKKYVKNSSGEITIYVKNVFAEDKKGNTKKLVGIDLKAR